MPNKEIPKVIPKVILRLPAVKEKTSLSRSSIYRLEAEGTFPRRVILSVNSVGWYEHEVDAFLASRPRADQKVGGGK